MIKIEFEAATGADLRKEMLDLLGIGAQQFTALGQAATTAAEVIKSVTENLPTEVVEIAPAIDETPKPEQTTRKRRSKAEIEAEAALAANTGTEEPPASTENVAAPEERTTVDETPATEEQIGEVAITAEDLTKKCVELGRNGKRDAVLAVFESQFGGATISKKDGKPQLTAEQYPAVMEALNAIA